MFPHHLSAGVWETHLALLFLLRPTLYVGKLDSHLYASTSLVHHGVSLVVGWTWTHLVMRSHTLGFLTNPSCVHTGRPVMTVCVARRRTRLLCGQTAGFVTRVCVSRCRGSLGDWPWLASRDRWRPAWRSASEGSARSRRSPTCAIHRGAPTAGKTTGCSSVHTHTLV